MGLVHLKVIGNWSVRLGFEARGAAIPEEKRGVNRVQQRGSVPPSFRAGKAYGPFARILESDFRMMAGSTRYRVISGKPGVVKQSPAQGNRICSGTTFAPERNGRQSQRSLNGNGRSLGLGADCGMASADQGQRTEEQRRRQVEYFLGVHEQLKNPAYQYLPC